RDTGARVLIIGGGDGGSLRRVLMHDPASVVMCEIDESVVRLCRRFMPEISDGAFDDPRASVVFADGAAYVAEQTEAFDAIIVDGSDAIGPAAILFSEDFYASCRRALRPGGVLVSQTGSPMFQADEFQLAFGNMSAVFEVVEPYISFVPTYPGTLWSYLLAGRSLLVFRGEAGRRATERGIVTRYWTPDVHEAAFALPNFVQEIVGGGAGPLES
ncbi:MAG: hypothetical protein ABR548_00660, partial [Actinomycetota bacterium]